MPEARLGLQPQFSPNLKQGSRGDTYLKFFRCTGELQANAKASEEVVAESAALRLSGSPDPKNRRLKVMMLYNNILKNWNILTLA